MRIRKSNFPARRRTGQLGWAGTSPSAVKANCCGGADLAMVPRKCAGPLADSDDRPRHAAAALNGGSRIQGLPEDTLSQSKSGSGWPRSEVPVLYGVGKNLTLRGSAGEANGGAVTKVKMLTASV